MMKRCLQDQAHMGRGGTENSQGEMAHLWTHGLHPQGETHPRRRHMGPGPWHMGPGYWCWWCPTEAWSEVTLREILPVDKGKNRKCGLCFVWRKKRPELKCTILSNSGHCWMSLLTGQLPGKTEARRAETKELGEQTQGWTCCKGDKQARLCFVLELSLTWPLPQSLSKGPRNSAVVWWWQKWRWHVGHTAPLTKVTIEYSACQERNLMHCLLTRAASHFLTEWFIRWLLSRILLTGIDTYSRHGITSLAYHPSAGTWQVSLWACQLVLVVKNPPAITGDRRDMGLTLWSEDPLEEGMATRSTFLA